MMSAHDVAVAALNEVAAHRHSESRVRAIASSITGAGTAASIEATAPKTTGIVEPAESHASFGFQSSSSNNSQSTVPDATTPPSSDGFSSQSQQSPIQVSQPSQPLMAQLPNSQISTTVVSTSAVAKNAGKKRTLDGYVKPAGSSSNSSVSPPVDALSGHVRNASSSSSATSSRELVSELRTRLSYAIVKVNKGWEDLPIDQVESRTSQAGSPTSSTSTIPGRRSLIASPRTAIATLQGNRRDFPQFGNVTSLSTSQIDPPIYSDGQPSRTYESFWREQSQKPGLLPGNMGSPASRNRSLAPSADITSAARYSTNPRRSEASIFTRPPALLCQSTSDLSQSTQLSLGAHTPSPRTPNRASHPVDTMLDTTNQKSLQERDAIETLIFMSSPGNSNSMGQTFPPPSQASQQPSPLRAEFGAPIQEAIARNADYSGVRSYIASDAGSATPLAKKRELAGTSQRRPGEDAYDALFDGMPDSDSSDDEIEIPMTPRRLTSSQT